MTKNIEPMFYLPFIDGDDLKVDTNGSRGSDDSGSDIIILEPGDTGLMPPETASVVEQIYRKGPDGKTVVDLVIEVEDVPSATEYEVRTSQI